MTTNKIFISYRREDAANVTGRIHDRLSQHFGKEAIFNDVISEIPLGIDFQTYLEEKVSQCKVLLTVIGKNWLTIEGDKGEPQLQSPTDHLRIEIESALQQNILVISLLVQDAKVPSKEELPKSIRELAFRQKIDIRPDPDFHKDMDRLIQYLGEYLQALGDRKKFDAKIPEVQQDKTKSEDQAKKLEREIKQTGGKQDKTKSEDQAKKLEREIKQTGGKQPIANKGGFRKSKSNVPKGKTKSFWSRINKRVDHTFLFPLIIFSVLLILISAVKIAGFDHDYIPISGVTTEVPMENSLDILSGIRVGTSWEQSVNIYREHNIDSDTVSVLSAAGEIILGHEVFNAGEVAVLDRTSDGKWLEVGIDGRSLGFVQASEIQEIWPTGLITYTENVGEEVLSTLKSSSGVETIIRKGPNYLRLETKVECLDETCTRISFYSMVDKSPNGVVGTYGGHEVVGNWKKGDMISIYAIVPPDFLNLVGNVFFSCIGSKQVCTSSRILGVKVVGRATVP